MNLTSATVIKDSVSLEGIRLITLQLKAPKFLDAQFEKHRMLSSNSSSDRAKPLKRLLSEAFFLPDDVYLNKSGMQGEDHLTDLNPFHKAVTKLHDLTAEFCTDWGKVHKQTINRYLLPYSYQDKVVTATLDQYEAFLKLRLSNGAQPEIHKLAVAMLDAISDSDPQKLKNGEWHLPYIRDDEDFHLIEAIHCSVARCARVSYSNHEGKKPNQYEDEALYKRLLGMEHLSCFEHQATPMRLATAFDTEQLRSEKGTTHIDRDNNVWSANFRGWIQYRKLLD